MVFVHVTQQCDPWVVELESRLKHMVCMYVCLYVCVCFCVCECACMYVFCVYVRVCCVCRV